MVWILFGGAFGVAGMVAGISYGFRAAAHGRYTPAHSAAARGPAHARASRPPLPEPVPVGISESLARPASGTPPRTPVWTAPLATELGLAAQTGGTVRDDRPGATLAKAPAARQPASDEAIRTDLELRAAELQTAVMSLSAELAQMRAYVTEDLVSPAKPTAKPAAYPDTRPGAYPGTRPAAYPDTRPGAYPGTRPAAYPDTRPSAYPDMTAAAYPDMTPAAYPDTRPAGRPASKPTVRSRQYAAMRLTVATITIMVICAIGAGSTEIALHGSPFFVFRSAGTGATDNNGLQENQGPGQPDAPGAHHPAPGVHHHKAEVKRHSGSAKTSSRS